MFTGVNKMKMLQIVCTILMTTISQGFLFQPPPSPFFWKNSVGQYKFLEEIEIKHGRLATLLTAQHFTSFELLDTQGLMILLLIGLCETNFLKNAFQPFNMYHYGSLKADHTVGDIGMIPLDENTRWFSFLRLVEKNSGRINMLLLMYLVINNSY